jgi:sialate O-acetylesterase
MKLPFNSLILQIGLVLLISSCTIEKKPLKLAPLFTSHMVLQQEAKVPIWGSASPGAPIEVAASWGETVSTQADEKGDWKVILETKKYGGPFALTIQEGTTEILLQDVLLGEVWLASGQSNMEWPMSARILNQEAEIKTADYPQIRMFSVPRDLEGTSLDKTSWKVTTPETVKQFSAVGYFFARKLVQELNIPVGIINTSWGGTRVEAWTSIEQLAQMEPSKEEALEIQSQGGVEGLKAYNQKISQEILAQNSAYLEAPAFAVPKTMEEWERLQLNDTHYADSDFDDTNWHTFQSEESDLIAFEFFFESRSLAEDGVVWMRKRFDLDTPEDFDHFEVEGGIDDYDYTYLNGKLIGKGFNCCSARSYEIPQGILKKKGNVLAVRIIDIMGQGGFRGNIFLSGTDKKRQLDNGEWKLKHQAFYLETNFQNHNLDLNALVENDNELQKQIKKGKKNGPNLYSNLYQNMIKPLIPYTIKGALWYQGESNVDNYQEYQTLFTGMITDWRARWGAEFPFYFVQIAPYHYEPHQSSQALREAQRKTVAFNKTGMAITLDIGEEEDIHPANKQEVGLRLARLALHNDYGYQDLVATGPLYKSKMLHPNAIDLSFDHIGNGLIAKPVLSGFEIASSEGPFVPAKAQIIGNQVRVSSPKVRNPQRVRYGWKNYFEGTLFNSEGLPASSFETP